MRTRLTAMMAALLLASASAASAQVQASPAYDLFRPSNPEVYGQIDFGGRVTSVSGDEARYQRYRDVRDGGFVDIPIFHNENETYWYEVQVRNGGYRDQRYTFEAARIGRFRVSFLYDQTPTYISNDTRSPYTPLPAGSGFFGAFDGNYSIPDDVQLGVENGTRNLRTELERLATPFASRIRRDSLGFSASFSPTSQWDLTVNYLNTKKEGNIPWGASFAFNLPIELPLAIDSRTNDFGLSAEWGNDRGMFRVGWDGSWYENNAYLYTWDAPTKLNDSTNSRAYVSANGTSRGRGTTWPTNTYNAFNVAGAYRLPGRSSLNGAFAYGLWSQDETIPPHTINSAIPVIPLARTTADAEATTRSFVLNFMNRDFRYVSFSARYRYYQFDNSTPEFHLERADGSHDEYVRLDQVPEPFSIPEIHKVGSEPFGYTRNYLDLDATITGPRYSALRFGYSLYDADLRFRLFENVSDNTFRVGYDVTGNPFVSFRTQYERSQRRGDLGTDRNNNGEVDVLEGAHEQPGMRHFDIADRNRDRFTVLANITPTDVVGFNASVAWTKDEFLNDDTPASDRFGLQDYKSRSFSLGLDAVPRDGVSAGASYSYEQYDGSFASRNASPGAQFTDARRNWGVTEDQRAHSFLVNLDLLQIAPKTEVRFDYSYTKYDGGYAHFASSALGTPSVLPDLTSNENRFSADLRYFVRRNVAIGFVYWFNKYEVDDWAFSPDIFTGVAQPPVRPDQPPTSSVSAVLLNYYYRPFTAHSGWVRLTYLF